MSKARAVFFDIDHTLFSHTLHDVPASAYTAIERLKQNGSQIALCTSRAVEELVNLPPKLTDLLDGVVCAQGGIIMDHGKIIASKIIDEGDAERVIDYCRRNDLVVRYSGVHGENSHDLHYTQEISDLFYFLYKMRPGQTLWKHQPLVNIIFYTREAQHVDAIRPLLHNSHLMVMHFANEVTAADANKASGMLELAAHWGFDQPQTVAFGDGYNDVEMIRRAGLGIAMGNGCDEARQAADYIADDMDRDGVYKACLHFGLIEEENHAEN